MAIRIEWYILDESKKKLIKKKYEDVKGKAVSDVIPFEK